MSCLPTTAPGLDPAVVAEVVELVAARTHVDLRAYRSGTVVRRVRNRMAHLAIDDPAAYLALLRTSATEPGRLLENVLVKVSRFYRCRPTFDRLRECVLPALAGASAGRPLQILCVGAGRGEEPWTFASLLEEAQIAGTVVASDVDPGALFATARATYPENAVADLPVELRDRCLEPVKRSGENFWRVRASLRHRVRVELRDALRCSPPRRQQFDLVSCRNLLIYLEAAAQADVLASLVSSLRGGGVLVLGEAEWPARELASRLTPLAPRLRIFATDPGAVTAYGRTA